MQQYTIEERREFYVAALEWFARDKPYDAGICWVLNVLGAKGSYHPGIYFPELWEQKPAYVDPYNLHYWFPLDVKEPRIEALKKAIDLCDTQLKKSES